MYQQNELVKQLAEGSLDQRMCEIYGCTPAQASGYARRFGQVVQGFGKKFGDNKSSELGLYSAPGRTEIGGNHTDHQLGCVLAGSVNLDTIAAAAPNGRDEIRLFSEGYPINIVNLGDLLPQEKETGTTAALIRGLVAKMSAGDYTIGGFDAYCTSNVMGGSGLSSSAAFETLVGVIINDLFCQGRYTAVEIAQFGQYAENIYFDKPSGLMDQMASSVGGIVAIDFGDVDHPVVEKVDFDFAHSGYALCIIDSQSDHANLTSEYASIPQEMKAVAALFGQDHLRSVTMEMLLSKVIEVRYKAGDRAFLRAIHFIEDNHRAQAEAAALKAGDFDKFLALVSESGRSSYMYLQNTARPGAIENQEVNATLALCEVYLGGRGAFRVHGGGFAGTVQAFVPCDMLDDFKTKMESALGQNTCHVLTIRPVGGVAV